MISEAEIVKAKINDIKKIIEIEELSYKDPWPREVFMIDFYSIPLLIILFVG